MPIKNLIIDIFNASNALSSKTISDFENIISFDQFPKNSILLEIGKKATTMFFVKRGLARAYHYHDGRDVTDYFAIDGQFIGAVPSLINGLPSQKGIHLIEESEIFYFLSNDFEKLCAEHHDLEHVSRMILAYALMDEQERIESLRFFSMRERYELLAKKYKGITNRCPLHYIASYLGTSQVSIGRIRAGKQ